MKHQILHGFHVQHALHNRLFFTERIVRSLSVTHSLFMCSVFQLQPLTSHFWFCHHRYSATMLQWTLSWPGTNQLNRARHCKITMKYKIILVFYVYFAWPNIYLAFRINENNVFTLWNDWLVIEAQTMYCNYTSTSIFLVCILWFTVFSRLMHYKS